MNNIQFKWQVQFSSFESSNLVKDFSEIISTDIEPTAESLLTVIKSSFDQLGIDTDTLEISNSLEFCDVFFTVSGGVSRHVRINIRIKPSLVINNKVFKLEELDM